MIEMGTGSYCASNDIRTFVPLSIGRYTSIASGLRIVSGQHPCVDAPRVVSTYPLGEQLADDRYPKCRMGGSVVIGSDVWVGEDVHIVADCEVGHGAVLAAGCIVPSGWIPPYAVVAGNPARIVKYRFDEWRRRKLLEIAWWDWPEEKIREQLHNMSDIERFLDVHAR